MTVVIESDYVITGLR